jgi:8-oxo-dGTP pyrophosphatase MutT (NUDIX family)
MAFFADIRRLAALGLEHSQRIFRLLRLGVRGVVVDGRGHVLLVRHTYVSGWYLPGGGVKAGESPQAALARELSEEAGVELLGFPLLHGFFFNPKASPRDYVACYVVRDFRVVPIEPNFEIAEARFFPADALPDDASPATRARLAEILKGVPFTDIW